MFFTRRTFCAKLGIMNIVQGDLGGLEGGFLIVIRVHVQRGVEVTYVGRLRIGGHRDVLR